MIHPQVPTSTMNKGIITVAMELAMAICTSNNSLSHWRSHPVPVKTSKSPFQSKSKNNFTKTPNPNNNKYKE